MQWVKYTVGVCVFLYVHSLPVASLWCQLRHWAVWFLLPRLLRHSQRAAFGAGCLACKGEECHSRSIACNKLPQVLAPRNNYIYVNCDKFMNSGSAHFRQGTAGMADGLFWLHAACGLSWEDLKVKGDLTAGTDQLKPPRLVHDCVGYLAWHDWKTKPVPHKAPP